MILVIPCLTCFPVSSATPIEWSLLVRFSNVRRISFFLTDFSAAFEVYVRRAYRAYTLLSIDYEEGDTLDDGEAPNIITWRFNLGQSHSPPSTPRFGSRYVECFLLIPGILTFIAVTTADKDLSVISLI